MYLFTTSLKAIDPHDGILKNWCGPNVPGISFKDADNYCQENGLGYCKIEGILVAEISADENNCPLWSQRIDFDIENN